MKEISGACFSCSDQLEFQFHGQTETYNPIGLSREYIDMYMQLGKPIINCHECLRRIRYEKQIDGKWREIEEW